jgi:hypothetical protein
VSGDSSDVGSAWAPVPQEVLEGVEVFVLDKQELMLRLQALRSHGPRSPQGVSALEQGKKRKGGHEKSRKREALQLYSSPPLQVYPLTCSDNACPVGC